MKMTEWGVERETKQGLKTQGWIYSTFAHSISAQTPVSNLTTSNPSELIIDCTYSQNWMVFACWCLMGKKKMLLLTFCIDQMIGKGEQESSRTCFFLVHQNSTAQTGTFFLVRILNELLLWGCSFSSVVFRWRTIRTAGHNCTILLFLQRAACQNKSGSYHKCSGLFTVMIFWRYIL